MSTQVPVSVPSVPWPNENLMSTQQSLVAVKQAHDFEIGPGPSKPNSSPTATQIAIKAALAALS